MSYTRPCTVILRPPAAEDVASISRYSRDSVPSLPHRSETALCRPIRTSPSSTEVGGLALARDRPDDRRPGRGKRLPLLWWSRSPLQGHLLSLLSPPFCCIGRQQTYYRFALANRANQGRRPQRLCPSVCLFARLVSFGALLRGTGRHSAESAERIDPAGAHKVDTNNQKCQKGDKNGLINLCLEYF